MMLDSKRPIVSINLTPLVDVSLVLVVIFMATAPMFLQGGFAVTAGERKTDSDQLSSSLEENILVKLQGETIALDQRQISESQLAEALKGLLAHSRSGRVIVNPEREVLHGRVVRVMDIAKQAGARKIVILGKAAEGSQAVRK